MWKSAKHISRTYSHYMRGEKDEFQWSTLLSYYYCYYDNCINCALTRHSCL